MWISRKDYDRLVLRNAELEGENRATREHLTATKTTLDWARVRLSQTEHERAQLLFNYTGVKIATPAIVEERATVGPSIHDVMSQMPSFDDIGDAEARRLGLAWNDDGTIKTRQE